MNPASTPQGSIEDINPIGRRLPEMTYLTTTPPPNLPCRDLLGNRDDYHKFCLPLYNASIVGDWDSAQVILGENRHLDLLGLAITENYDTALHVAASTKSTRSVEKFVKNLVNQMTNEQLELQNKNYNTALCLAAASGNVKIVNTMVKRNKDLLDIPGSLGMMPLYMASLLGKRVMVNYLYDNGMKMSGNLWTDDKRSWVLQRCVENDLFDVALKIVTDFPELSFNGNVLRVLARKVDAFRRIIPNPLEIATSKIYAAIHIKVGPVIKPNDAMQLLRIIWTSIVKLPKDTVDDILRGPVDIISGPSVGIIDEDGMQKPKHTSRVLFVATEMGNVDFVVELIRQYPDLMWKRNDHNQTIFHVAVVSNYFIHHLHNHHHLHFLH